MLSGTRNTRDLGRYILKEEGKSLKNMILRSDALLSVSEDDIKVLLKNNIRTIIDLRSVEEVMKKPNALRENEEFNYFNLEIFGGGALPKSGDEVPVSYLSMVDEGKSILNVMKTIESCDGGVVYHCAVGKDRTGVVSALLLLLGEVSNEDIVKDYTDSWENLKEELIEYCKTNERASLDIVTPKKEYMERFLEEFIRKYNSVEEYFIKIGLSEKEIKGLKDKLICI